MVTSSHSLPPSGPILTDELGKLVSDALERLRASPSVEAFLQTSRGPSDISPDVCHIPHPASSLLDEYRNHGVRMRATTPNWDRPRKLEALARGAHQSSYEHIAFVREEFADFVRKKFWVVLPAASILEHPALRLSPLGCVPQHGRRPRLIVDLSFHDVNQDTAALAPAKAMQFGYALRRVLWTMASADPAHGPVYMGKYDIADGYYRIQLTIDSMLPLAVTLPIRPGEAPLVAVPLVLPMGWKESAPYFCAETETVADLANDRLALRSPISPHRLEDWVLQQPTTTLPTADAMVGAVNPRPYASQPLAYVDVYIDDLIGLAQGDHANRMRVSRAILHSLDDVFRPLTPGDSPHRREPLSASKMAKGDGYMALHKEILGWNIDGQRMTIHLTERRFTKLMALLADFPRTRTRVSVKKWHQVLGELRSMAMALPGCRGLFSSLQLAFRSGKRRLRLTAMMHDFLDDFRWLVRHLHHRPARIYTLFPGLANTVGATDASGFGLGGVFFVARATAYDAYVWRDTFPASVTEHLVSETNPTGQITNSDLELAATVGHHDVVAHTVNVTEATIGTLHDNTPAVYWNRKGSASTTGPAAYLLRLQALHARHYSYVATHDFIPGHLNRMADDASRLSSYSDTAFLHHFDSFFPQPRPWVLCTLRSETRSALISALLRQRSDPGLWSSDPQLPPANGTAGWHSVPPTPWIPGSPKGTTLFRTSKFSQLGTAMDASHPAANPYDLQQLRTPFEMSDRLTKPWGPTTSA